MRTSERGGPGERPLSAIIQDAVDYMRQDLGEYAFIGLVGAVGAAMTGLVLRIIGGSLADALIAPCVGIWALATFAAASSAVLRVDEDNLHPDAARAFVETLIRAPFLLVPFAPAIVLSGLGVYIAAAFSDTIGHWPATGIVLALFVLSFMNAYQRTLFVPALFSRGTSVREAAGRARAVHRGGGSAAVALAWLVVLLPAGIIALGGIAAGFGTFSTAVTSFAFVASMPFAAGVMSLLYATASRAGFIPAEAVPDAKQSRRGGSAQVAERLGRHVR